MGHRPPKPSPSPGEAETELDETPESASTKASDRVNEKQGSQDPAQSKGDAPPLPDEPLPLPAEAPPAVVDDGWEPMWDDRAQAFYFYNRLTKISQWDNPRVPTASQQGPSGATTDIVAPSPAGTALAAGYNPAIHGDYDPNADYAQAAPTSSQRQEGIAATASDPSAAYAATGAFNRFTGKWQQADFTPERFSDDSKSKRQMNAFFDVDAAANSHDGRSLRTERQQKKLSKAELKAFKEKRRDKKEEKRRAWLKD